MCAHARVRTRHGYFHTKSVHVVKNMCFQGEENEKTKIFQKCIKKPPFLKVETIRFPVLNCYTPVIRIFSSFDGPFSRIHFFSSSWSRIVRSSSRKTRPIWTQTPPPFKQVITTSRCIT